MEYEQEINQVSRKYIDQLLADNKPVRMFELTLKVSQDLNHLNYNQVCKMVRAYCESQTNIKLFKINEG